MFDDLKAVFHQKSMRTFLHEREYSLPGKASFSVAIFLKSLLSHPTENKPQYPSNEFVHKTIVYNL
jgi:hypothetical protein